MLKIILSALVLLYPPLSSDNCSSLLDGLAVVVVIGLRLVLTVIMKISGMIVISDLMIFAFGTDCLMLVRD